MALYHFSAKMLSRGSRNTVGAIAYRAGCKLYDERTGQSFDYRHKDVEHVELLLPKDAPSWAVEIQKLMLEDRRKGVQAWCDIVEAAEKRVDSQVWREVEFALHRELTKDQNMALAREFVQDQICARGITAQLNFHFDVDEKTKEETPHCHVNMTTRRLDEAGMSSTKEEDWNKKELLLELRVQWEEYSNFYLKLYGHDVRIDHRSHKARGIEMEPQPKLGKGILEQERRGNPRSTPGSFATEKMQAFHECKLRNLYRIVRRPDVVLEIASKHNATFMWADVQKVLHRYVDELPLFQKLDAKLKTSSELILLKSDPEGQDIYTTRTLLNAEKSLIENAEALSNSKTHGVQDHHINVAIKKANKDLKKFGGLSSDQKHAIAHVTDEGQLKCVVGIAGAGKTTALGVCHDIWKAEGYAVYGLAPTGKAAQNLEQGGMASTTLHKFLKSFEEGRCHYNQNSVLVLDEAGMVDMERFEKLLSAVNHLGTKLIVVGDGAQLQPVEAGPAFRLVTTRLGKSELNTVVRQKEDWQRDATVLFGKQETQAAIQKYANRGHVHIVEEKLPSLQEAMSNNDHEGIVKLYEVSSRTSSLIYREMARDVKKENPHETNTFSLIKQHQDFERYMSWKSLQKSSAAQILKEGDVYLPILKARALDPTKMAMLFGDKKLNKEAQNAEAISLLKKSGLESLVGIEKQPGLRPSLRLRQSVDVRQHTKDALIRAWHSGLKESPDKTSLMLAFSNKDVNDLNRTARSLLKDSGHLSREDFTYTIAKMDEDDFGRKRVVTEEKSFSEGDRIVFTRKAKGMSVKNGTMGTITGLNQQTIQVKLEKGKEISFAPKLNPYFDQGWAVTIHKSQGTTVDTTYLLASYEMTQNLAYVAMTRHQYNVYVFGSSLDFWRPEKLPEVLSKSGEKLSAADYLDAGSLNKLMQRDDRLLSKIFERVSNELDAMGAVSKKAFWQVADHFLGIKREQDIRVTPDHTSLSVREEVRAENLLQTKSKASITQDVVISQPLKGSAPQSSKPFIEASLVEAALKQNMSSFADDIFSSIGEPYNAAASSSSERRYGKKGHIAVNLKTGAWIDHKDSDKSGGPLHMLTKIKGLGFREAVEYGASWAGLSQRDLSERGLSQTSTERSTFAPLVYSPQQDEKEAVRAENKAKIDKAQALWVQGRPIQGTIAERYLREHRKIEGPLSERILLEGTLSEGDLPNDLRYLPFFTDRQSQRSFPCLMAGVRSERGDITAVQITFLNAHTAAKADIPVAKRSFGVVKGSAVTLQGSLSEGKASNVLFVAEGLETALSLKSAGVQGTIKASLGLSNIKRMAPDRPDAHIVICADHDAPDSPAAKSLKKSVLALQERGLVVIVIKPDKVGEDFNDVLKAQGPQGVRDILERSLPKDLLKIVHPEKDLLLEAPVFAKNALERKAVEKNTITLPQKSEEGVTLKETTVSMKNEGVFEQLTQQCVQKLYAYLGEERIDLTPDLMKRVEKQAEKAANFIFYAHTLKGTQPMEKETKHFLLRAKYELDRIPEIRDTIIAEWKKASSYKGEKDELIAHMVAERQASIEGRMYLEAKQAGFKPLSNIPDLAEKELKAHRTTTEAIAQKLVKKHGLSEMAATHCAKDILRHQEIHGEKPSDSQMAAMVQISRELDKQGYPISMGPHNIEYLRRREGDLQFREMASQGKDLSGFKEFPHREQSYFQSQTRIKSYETEKSTRALEENARDYGMELSM